jgi:hypothetical protein
VTINAYIPVKNSWSGNSVVYYACQLILFFFVTFYLFRAMHIFDFRLVINCKIDIGDRYKKGTSLCSKGRCLRNRENHLYKQEAV